MSSQITFGFYESQVDSFGFADLSICSPNLNGRQSELVNAVASVNATVSSQVEPIIRVMESFNTVFDSNTVFDMWLDKFFSIIETVYFMVLMSPVYFETYLYTMQRCCCSAYTEFIDTHREGVGLYCFGVLSSCLADVKCAISNDTLLAFKEPSAHINGFSFFTKATLLCKKASYCLSEINCASRNVNETSQKIYNECVLGSHYSSHSIVFSESLLRYRERNKDFCLFLSSFVKQMLIDTISNLFFIFNPISLFSLFTSKPCLSGHSKLPFYIIS